MNTRSSTARTLARIVGLTTAAAAVWFGGTSLASTMAHQKVVSTLPLTAPIDRIDVPGLPGDLTIIGSDGPHRLLQTVHTALTAPDTRYSIADGLLVYHVDGCRWFDSRCGVDLTADVDPRSPVTASSTGGNLTATGLDGGLTLSSSAGDVTVRASSGKMNIESSAGDVRAIDIAPSSLVAHSSAGDVRVSLTRPPQLVSADSSAGEVTVTLPRDETSYRVEAESSAGSTNVSVRTDPQATRIIRVSSSAGDVTVRYADS